MTLYSRSQSPTSMTVASHVTETHRERVFLHSMSLLISFGISDGHDTIQVVKQSFSYETVSHLLIFHPSNETLFG